MLKYLTKTSSNKIVISIFMSSFYSQTLVISIETQLKRTNEYDDHYFTRRMNQYKRSLYTGRLNTTLLTPLTIANVGHFLISECV